MWVIFSNPPHPQNPSRPLKEDNVVTLCGMRFSNVIKGLPLFVIDIGISGNGWFYNPGDPLEIPLVYSKAEKGQVQTETLPNELPVQEGALPPRYGILAKILMRAASHLKPSTTTSARHLQWKRNNPNLRNPQQHNLERQEKIKMTLRVGLVHLCDADASHRKKLFEYFAKEARQHTMEIMEETLMVLEGTKPRRYQAMWGVVPLIQIDFNG